MIKKILSVPAIVLLSLSLIISSLSLIICIVKKNNEYRTISPMVKCKGILSKTCVVDLGTSIEDSRHYLGIGELLRTADSKDTFIFKLAGDGGDVSGAIYLLDQIHKSKAYVVGEVDDSVYSAHAILAMAMPHIVINSTGIIMFHFVSGTNMVDVMCSDIKGLDRGLSAEEKCKENANYVVNSYNSYILNIYKRFLSSQEINNMLTGHDLYMTIDEIKQRLSVNG